MVVVAIKMYKKEHMWQVHIQESDVTGSGNIHESDVTGSGNVFWRDICNCIAYKTIVICELASFVFSAIYVVYNNRLF